MTTYEGRTFDREEGFDIRSLDFLVVELLAAPKPSAYDRVQDAAFAALAQRVAVLEHPTPTPPPAPTPPPPPVPTAVVWPVTIDLDQQAEGECVGHGWAHWLASAPKPLDIGTATLANPTAEHLYERAQQIDGQVPDEQSGTTVTAGAKATQEHGGIASYHWALTVKQAADAIMQVGPVVLGIPWTADMMHPDASGQIHATGSIVGGHCLLANGYDPATQLFRLHNSWGAGWGINGGAFISAADLATLLAQQGEACVPIKA